MAQREARLAKIASLRGKQIAEWGEKDASAIAEKDRASLKNRGVGPGGHNYALMNDSETPAFEKRMSGSMSAELEAQRKRDGKSTGYDAAMRDTPAPKRPRLATTPMFQKKKQ